MDKRPCKCWMCVIKRDKERIAVNHQPIETICKEYLDKKWGK